MRLFIPAETQHYFLLVEVIHSCWKQNYCYLVEVVHPLLNTELLPNGWDYSSLLNAELQLIDWDYSSLLNTELLLIGWGYSSLLPRERLPEHYQHQDAADHPAQGTEFRKNILPSPSGVHWKVKRVRKSVKLFKL